MANANLEFFRTAIATNSLNATQQGALLEALDRIIPTFPVPDQISDSIPPSEESLARQWMAVLYAVQSNGGPPVSGGVTDVTASPPLASSGGDTPNISLDGVVDVEHGGTGVATLPAHALLVGAGTGNVGAVGPGAAVLPLLAAGGAADPAFAAMPLSSLDQSGALTGQVPVWDGTEWTPQDLPSSTPRQAFIRQDRQVFATSADTSGDATFRASNLEGNAILVWMSQSGGSGATPTAPPEDDAGNTYVLVDHVNDLGANRAIYLYVAEDIAAHAAGNAVSTSWTGSGENVETWVLELEQVPTLGVVDASTLTGFVADATSLELTTGVQGTTIIGYTFCPNSGCAPNGIGAGWSSASQPAPGTGLNSNIGSVVQWRAAPDAADYDMYQAIGSTNAGAIGMVSIVTS